MNKTSIKPNVEKYVRTKSASGSVSSNSGDLIALGLNGATLDEVYEIADALKLDIDDLRKKYANLNPGQQRMNLGNRIRKAVRTMNVAKEGSGDDLFGRVTSKIQKAVAARATEVAKAKAESAKQVEASKAAKSEKVVQINKPGKPVEQKANPKAVTAQAKPAKSAGRK